jgi:hypothetical protein
MFPDFEKCVAAIVDTLLLQEKSRVKYSENMEATLQFLRSTHAGMPDYLRLAFRILTLLFDAWPVLTKGRTFHQLDAPSRLHQLNNWNSSRLSFCAGLIAFYRSLTTFSYYYEIYERDHEVGAAHDQN